MAGRPKESVSPSPLRGARPRRSLGGVTVLLRRRVMSNSSTCSEQKTLDQIDAEELARRLIEIDDRLDRLEQATTDKLNEAYRQGVADERKARTGHDPKVADDG